ncbi:MAG: hypothetical protein Q8K66_04025 [Sediminibacterium sp.]|nr:hypothetical protein [Sediminibacterium sp.]MDP3128106.1 hypothetical protein [Sediminibacterium sp.]MDP3667152.1 hypothetical protein [Sediminibacterium sp.]
MKNFAIGSKKTGTVSKAVNSLKQKNIDLSVYLNSENAETSTRPYSESTFVKYTRYDKAPE